MSEVITPPAVSMPIESGATSRRRRSDNCFRSVSDKDCGLDCSSVGHGLVGVDRLVQFLPVEEVLQQLLNFGNPCGTSDQNNIVDRGLVKLSIPQSLLHWIKGSFEEVRAEFLKPRPGDRGVEVDALKQRVNLNAGLGRG